LVRSNFCFAMSLLLQRTSSTEPAREPAAVRLKAAYFTMREYVWFM